MHKCIDEEVSISLSFSAVLRAQPMYEVLRFGQRHIFGVFMFGSVIDFK